MDLFLSGAPGPNDRSAPARYSDNPPVLEANAPGPKGPPAINRILTTLCGL